MALASRHPGGLPTHLCGLAGPRGKQWGPHHPGEAGGGEDLRRGVHSVVPKASQSQHLGKAPSSQASLVAYMVKKPPAMQETQVRSLG